MEEYELRESLRRLPDARPGAGFTAEVLARVERGERQRTVAAGGGAGDQTRGGAGWRPALLAAGLAAALVAAVGLWQPPGGGRWPGAGGGEAAAPAVLGPERLAERVDGARPGGGEQAPDAAPRSVVATPGAADRRGARADSLSPQGGRRWQPAPGDRGPAATEADGSIDGEKLASATVVAGLPDDGSAAGGRGGAAPPAAALAADHGRDVTPPAADTLASLPGADFFAAPPAAGVDLAALPAAERLARLRAERESLARRLAAFRNEVPPAEPPVVLLASDEGLELVFDLARWAAPPPAAEAAGAARPAVHSTQGPPRRF